MRREGRARLGLVLVSTLATVAVLALGFEVAANIRYYRWRASFDNEGWIGRLTVASRNPTLLWEYRPHGDAGGVATNRYGFRDADYPTPLKPAGTRRIAFIGDSVTLGMGVVPEDTFVARVGAMAVAAGHPTQTLNFGVDGYNAVQIRELLTAKVLAFQPDQVVYVLCLNDFDFTDSSGRKIAYFRKPRFFLPQWLEQRYRSLRRIEFHRYHFRRHQGEVFDAIRSMRDVMVAEGKGRMGFLLAIVPVFPDKPGDPHYFDHYPLQDIHESFSILAEELIPTHDLLADFRRQPPPPQRYLLDLWHLSAEGHRVVAEGLYPDLFPPP